MTWKPQRRQRFEGFSAEQATNAILDDVDVLEATLHEHIEEDELAFAKVAESFQEWKLTSLRSQNRMLFAVVMALIAALAGIVVPLVSR